MPAAGPAPRWSRHLAVAAVVLLLPAAVPLEAAATDRAVDGPTQFTATVAIGQYDAYLVSGSDRDLRASIVQLAGGPFDVYVVGGRDLGSYSGPPLGFRPVEVQEGVVGSCTVRQPLRGGMYLVIDNRNFTASGATPTMNLTYTVTFEVDPGVPWGSLPGSALYVTLFLLVAAVYAARYYRRVHDDPVLSRPSAVPGAFLPPRAPAAHAVAPPPPSPAGPPQAMGPGQPPAAPCPVCRAPLFEGAPSCPSCGQPLRWGAK